MIPGIILGESVFNGELSEHSKKRIDMGIKLLRENEVDKIILSGGVRKRKGYKELIGKFSSLAEIMENYALKKGVKHSKIILEDLSEDTVGQLIFLKEGILKPMNIREGIIVTSDYHLLRVKKEADKIFGKKYHFTYKPIKATCPYKESVKKEEKKKINLFYKTFDNVDFDNAFMVLITLTNNHSFYKQNPEFYKKELHNMIAKNSK